MHVGCGPNDDTNRPDESRCDFRRRRDTGSFRNLDYHADGPDRSRQHPSAANTSSDIHRHSAAKLNGRGETDFAARNFHLRSG